MSAQPSAQAAQLTALVELISSSVNEVIAAYNAAGRDVPSLESLNEGPLEVPATTPQSLTRARQIIEAACAQLCATVAQPGDCIVNVRFPVSPYETRAELRRAAESICGTRRRSMSARKLEAHPAT